MTAMTHQEWTISKLLEEYPTLGLPHFQRGHVWNADTVSLLLESLYYDTPCGTFILWQAESNRDSGIPLPGGNVGNMKLLIIDGQQRIRSIHDALGDLDTEVNDDEGAPKSDEQENDKSGKTAWCLNLARVPKLAELVDGHLIAEKPLFMKVSDPTDGRPGKRYRHNLIPLRMLMEEDHRKELSNHVQPSGSGKAEGDAENAKREILEHINGELRKQVRAMKERKVIVLIKGEGHSLSDMVQLYNRINSGGMRVQAEEKAFASLVSIYPATNTWLKDLFERVHPDRDSKQQGDLERDEVLRRKKESRFGFKLFMRAFVQAAAHHTGYSIGSSGLSFAAVESQQIARYLRHEDERVEQLFDGCAKVVIDTAHVLRDDLRCDGFQFLPETASLVPVFQLLLKYPKLLDKPAHRSLVALFLLKLQLAELNQRELMELANSVRSTNELSECAAILSTVDATKKLSEERLKYSNSLQDRYVQLLYWLERRHEARDFSYEHEKLESKRPGLPAEEVPIAAASCDPEKQHIVPYSHLRSIFGITGKTRISTHPANNIGNITYISHDLNSFDKGLGDEPLDFGLEREKRPANLVAHFLAADSSDTSLTEQYDLAKRDTATPQQRKDAFTAFAAFCAARRGLIIKGFGNWLSELETAAGLEEEIEIRTEPVPQLFYQSTEDLIRSLDFHNELENRLIALALLQERVSVKATRTGEQEGDEKTRSLSSLEFKLKGRSVAVMTLRFQHGTSRLVAALSTTASTPEQQLVQHILDQAKASGIDPLPGTNDLPLVDEDGDIRNGALDLLDHIIARLKPA